MTTEPDVDPLVTFDWTTSDSPSTAVVTAVAEAAGTDPVAIEPLYEAIDPDALDALVAPPTALGTAPSATIEFVYQDYRVRVGANGRGHLFDRDDIARPTAEGQRFEAPTQAE